MEMDRARKTTDRQLKIIENRVSRTYKQAQSEITEKWNAYMERGEKRLSALRDSGDMEAYRKALESYTFKNQWYKDMVDETTTRLAHANEIALAYINDQIPSIYALNYNQAKEIADEVGVRFDIVNEDVVKRMIKDNNIKLPKKKVQIPKDKRWNTRQLNSSVLQGILQGEDMRKIAKRILPIVDNNRKAAIRNARTMVTGAENRGRQDSYKRLSDDGIVMNKVWIATPDDRTRDWHLDMDGQEVGVDEDFIDGLGNFLEYPGDPGGAPETVYNCRCTMITHVIGFRRDDGSISTVDFDKEGQESLHDRQMEAEKIKRSREEKQEVQKPEEKQIEEKPFNRNNYVPWDRTKQESENARMDITSDEERILYNHSDYYGYIQTSNSFTINKALRIDQYDSLLENQKKTVKTLQKVIDRNTISNDTMFVRMIGETYMNKSFGIDPAMLNDIINNFSNYEETFNGFVGMRVKEKGFMSVSSSADKNVFTERPVTLELFTKNGKNAYVTNNYYESETIFGQNTEYDISGFRVEEVADKWGYSQKRLFIEAMIV